jgi:hypothetical protein
MSVEQDIQQLEDLVKRIEEYVSRGIREPGQHEEILSIVDKADTIYDKIITGYIDMPDMPSVQQAYLVSSLQERLHHAKHGLPSPESGQKRGDGKTDKEIVIYTTPT